jgi:hypothetical protein
MKTDDEHHGTNGSYRHAKSPPASTDIYPEMGKFVALP